MSTKIIDKLSITDEQFTQVVKNNANSIKKLQTNEFNKDILDVLIAFENIAEKNRGFVKMANKKVFYHTGMNLLLPDLSSFELGHCVTSGPYNSNTFNNKFEGYKGNLINKDEVVALFNNNKGFLKETFKFDIPSVFSVTNNDKTLYEYTINSNGSNANRWNGTGGDSYHIPVFRLKNAASYHLKLLNILKEGLIPKDFTKNEVETYEKMLELLVIDPEFIKLIDGELVINSSCLKKIDSIDDKVYFDVATIREEILKTGVVKDKKTENQITKDLIEDLLNCDKIRADIQPYDIKILQDANRGHWDLWDDTKNSDLKLTLSDPLMARNPLADVKKNATVGIDFGTKSTIVMLQEGNEHIIPMRIGTGNFSEKIDSSHYENPTALNFIDINSFMTAYKSKKGRPNTKWADLTSSHTAYQSLLSATDSDYYYSFLYELKQWAGNSEKSLRINDKKKETSVILKSYLELQADELDPIEIYAYYIGLYINNMHNAIYIDYILSYPATYEKNIRDKMVESFTKGLKKSLPTQVLENDEIMQNFRVTIGASEPVAYAVCALDQYGFAPVDDEKVFYGVFDFGGGTSDFDFGLFREATAKERRYDYIVESFGDSGDRYLGGENLLELLAFEVFVENKDVLIENQISFTLPPECNKFLGSEVLLSESQEAKINMSTLMQKLRPYWEKRDATENVKNDSFEDDFESEFDDNVSEHCKNEQFLLLDTSGTQKNVSISINPEKIETILYNRIEKGVKNFFDSLIFAMNMPNQDNDVVFVNVFLAGNSSKSPILKDIFDKYTKDYNEMISEKKDSVVDVFKIFPPLGTKEAVEIQKQNGITNITDKSPTGKTGVAFGVLKSRPGSKINIIRERKTTDEIKFKYFIGFNKKGKFNAITNRDIKYNEWIELIDASEQDFSIYYTDLPSCHDGNTSIEDVKLEKCRIFETFDDANVYYRAVSPTEIEYAVAKLDENEQMGQIVSEIVKINLK